MRKNLFAFSMVFLLVAVLASSLVVAEYSDSNETDDMDSNETEASDSAKASGAIVTKTRINADYDRDGTKIVTKTITELKDGVEVERNVVTRIKDGKVVREMVKEKERRKFIDSDGKERNVKLMMRERMENGKTRKLFRAEEGGLEVRSDLDISENESADGEVKLRVKLKDGKHKDIKILPDRASEIAKARMRAKYGNDSLEIREIMHKNVPKVVYHLEGNSSGKFLGVFKSNMNVQTEVDAETGEVVLVKKPWWAFMVKQDAEVDAEVSA
ncbi:MAG: hypothetical protein Q7R87_02450 [Nanoarchaeota archaeon]|nr:hypothetical protein [Nanoarchaeota archaeon]